MMSVPVSRTLSNGETKVVPLPETLNTNYKPAIGRILVEKYNLDAKTSLIELSDATNVGFPTGKVKVQLTIKEDKHYQCFKGTTLLVDLDVPEGDSWLEVRVV